MHWALDLKLGDFFVYFYRLFSEEQYFDANGFFILTVFSGPILLNCFFIVVSQQCSLCSWRPLTCLFVGVVAVECVGDDGEGRCHEAPEKTTQRATRLTKHSQDKHATHQGRLRIMQAHHGLLSKHSSLHNIYSGFQLLAKINGVVCYSILVLAFK